MFVQLENITPHSNSGKLVLSLGQTMRIGRLKGENHYYVPDAFMAPVHFSLTCTDGKCVLETSNNGTSKHLKCAKECFLASLRHANCPSGLCRIRNMSGECRVSVNGKKVAAALLRDNDVLVAGTTVFLVRLSDTPIPDNSPSSGQPPAKRPSSLTSEQQGGALAYFANARSPLYAILDAARDPKVLQTLRVHGELYYSLYEGPAGQRLDAVAPYLVELPDRSPLLETLVREHWGQSWGVFVHSASDFKTLRRHLRKFLMVENRGKQLYFRFYDPRVLRVFLPTCTPAETEELFGPVYQFVVEDELPGRAWAFHHRRAVLRSKAVHF